MGGKRTSAFSGSCKDLCLFQGIQFFTRVWDDDGAPGRGASDELVDNFSIVLTTSFLIPGAGFTTETFYSGFFGFGTLQLSFRVSCAANFFGPNCATDCVHQCDPNGECVEGIDTFTCECNIGFTGADCMTDINDCEGVDCGNGVCRDTGVNSFTCECNAGFTGSQCLTNIDDCVNASCGQNGECVDQINSFTCMCDTGFTGADCMTDINHCEGVDCGNGVCRDTGVNSFTCECIAGFTGSQCLTNIDDCVNASCGQNGKCVDQINSFTCMCDTGFTGADCMTNIDDCASANCSENSQCVDGVDTFSCVCNPGFEFNGTFCENAASQGTHIHGLPLKRVCASNYSVFVFRRQSRKHLCRNWGTTGWTAWEHCSGIDLGLYFGDCYEKITAEGKR